MTMHLSSSSFADLGLIPSRYTCEGLDISVPLRWSLAPRRTRSFALVLTDPDAPDPHAPTVTWVHWILYNIPHTCRAIAEGATRNDIGTAVLDGLNDWRKTGYRGPCPPVGMHRYVFQLFALDDVLPDMKNPSKAALDRAMQGHVLARTELTGLYQRKGSSRPLESPG